MTEPKKAAYWNIAIIYLIIAGAIAYAINIIFTLFFLPFFFRLMPILFELITTNNKLFLFLTRLTVLALGVFVMWLGIKYSAKSISTLYFIDDKKRVINLATLYVTILQILSIILKISRNKITGFSILYSFIDPLIWTAIFYFLSRKYIKNTEVNKF